MMITVSVMTITGPGIISPLLQLQYLLLGVWFLIRSCWIRLDQHCRLQLFYCLGPTAAKAIGDLASQQAAGKQYGMNCEPPPDRNTTMEQGVSFTQKLTYR
jgi:hypothetical protein